MRVAPQRDRICPGCACGLRMRVRVAHAGCACGLRMRLCLIACFLACLHPCFLLLAVPRQLAGVTAPLPSSASGGGGAPCAARPTGVFAAPPSAVGDGPRLSLLLLLLLRPALPGEAAACASSLQSAAGDARSGGSGSSNDSGSGRCGLSCRPLMATATASRARLEPACC